MNQQTIKESVTVSGVNVYTGSKNSAAFHPAKENAGILFVVKGKTVPARLHGASHERKSVSVSHDSATVYLVEHLLAATYALGIDNLVIELSDNTCPTVPNCAQEYFQALKDQRQEQRALKQVLHYAPLLSATLHAEQGPDVVCVKKAETFSIDYRAGYPHKAIGEQVFATDITQAVFEKEIMAARSPAFLVNKVGLGLIRTLGWLGKTGITDENYLLITSKSSPTYANKDGFGVRYGGKEFVRHKVLDVLGTLALVGPFVRTSFSFYKTGHAFDLQALKQIVAKGWFKVCTDDAR